MSKEPEHKKRCKKCIYSKVAYFGGKMIYCDYYLMTNTLRPCPPEDCTVYKGKKRNAKNRSNSSGGADGKRASASKDNGKR